MARLYQVPQHAFGWLVGGCALASLPHLISGPPWLVALVPSVLLWRVMIQRGRLHMPPRWLRAVLLCSVILATLYSHGTVLGPEAGVTLLVAAFSLKLVEMFTLRDAYVVIVLAYFVLATVFLAFRDALTTLYVIAVLLLITAALVGINQPESGVRPRQHLRVAGGQIAQAIPLMLVLFILVPRIPPLWSLPQDTRGARTGMSDSMSPGQVSRLSLSTELAFRVEFEGALPPPSQRYWRGLTLSWFDGRSWSQAMPSRIPSDFYLYRRRGDPPDWYRQWQALRDGPSYQYRVVMEPTYQQWVFALAAPFSSAPELAVARDFRMVSEGDIREVLAYQVASYPAIPGRVEVPAWEKEFNLRLPEAGNSRARQLARQWRREAGSDRAFVERLLRWFRDEPFYYTLEPPPLGNEPVDEFLFDSRRGFCEHYSSAFTFMLRAAGIPARVVVGYQGGEPSELGGHLLVYQYDAHAWSEAWLPGEGWVALDPTAAVAPERIEFGLREALARLGQNDSLPGFAALRDSALGRQLRYLSDYVTFTWQKWVLGYRQDQQSELLARWLGQLSPLKVAMVLAASGLVIFAVFALWLFFTGRRPPLSWWQQEFWQVRKMLAARQVSVPAGAGPREMARLGSQKCPAAGPALQAWARQYELVVYRMGEGDGPGDELRQRLVSLRRDLKQALRRRQA